MRLVQAFSTQKSSNVTVTLAGIGLTHYPQLVLRVKASTLSLLAHFGIRDPRRITAGGICKSPYVAPSDPAEVSLSINILMH